MQKLFELHAQICSTLSNPKRLEILNSLRNGEKTVSELVALTNSNQANISQHLAILKTRGVVSTRRKGNNIYYKISNSKIIKACDLIREVLLEQLEENKEILKEV